MTEREELRAWYKHPYWARRVDKMSDERVHTCLIKLRQIREENKHGKAC